MVKKTRQRGKSSGIVKRASAIAAMASAMAAALAVSTAYLQGARDKRVVSLRKIEQFESQQSEFGNPYYCIQFLKSIISHNDIQTLMSNDPIKNLSVTVSEGGDILFLLCVAGLEGRNGDARELVRSSATAIRRRFIGTDAGSAAIDIDFLTIKDIKHFTIDFLNSHNSLVDFFDSGVGERKILEEYVRDQVYEARPLTELMELLCDRGGRKLRKAYPLMVRGIVRAQGKNICPSEEADSRKGSGDEWCSRQKVRQRARHGCGDACVARDVHGGFGVDSRMRPPCSSVPGSTPIGLAESPAAP